MEGLCNRGERRRDVSSLLDAVEPHDGNVLGNAHARLSQDVQGPQRHSVVHAHKSIEAGSCPEQHPGSFCPGIPDEGALHGQPLVEGDAVLRQGPEKSSKPVLGFGVAGRAADESETRAAVVAHEMADDDGDPIGAVRRDAGYPRDLQAYRHP